MIKFTCPTCGTEAWAPDELIKAAGRDPSIHFHCGYGHASHFRMTDKQFAEEHKIELETPKPTADNIVAFPKRV